MKCEICPDAPPNEATVLITEMYMCNECFEALVVNIPTSALEEMRIL